MGYFYFINRGYLFIRRLLSYQFVGWRMWDLQEGGLAPPFGGENGKDYRNPRQRENKCSKGRTNSGFCTEGDGGVFWEIEVKNRVFFLVMLGCK